MAVTSLAGMTGSEAWRQTGAIVLSTGAGAGGGTRAGTGSEACRQMAGLAGVAVDG